MPNPVPTSSYPGSAPTYNGGLDYLGSLLGINSVFGVGSGDPSNVDRNALRGLGSEEAGSAEQQLGYAGQLQGLGAQGWGNYQTDRGAMAGTQNYLRGQMMGQNSLAAEQLRQGLQQNLAANQSMAASANPNDSAMAARRAMMNMNQANYGLAGQQALAGIQERNAAAQSLGQLQLGQSGQDLQSSLGAYGAANSAYGNANNAYGNANNAYSNALQRPQQTDAQGVSGFLGGVLKGLI